MKAIVYSAYGSPEVLKLKELEKPAPNQEQVLVKIAYASINSADAKLMRGKPFLARMAVGGLRKPKKQILGSDMAGTIEALGAKVSQFKLGDKVFGDLSAAGFATFAEYICIDAKHLSLIPAGVSMQEAAAAPMAAVCALQALKKAGVKPGDMVLINGASGGVGMYAVQIAKTIGAKVTAVGSSAKQPFLQTIGADATIDYQKQDLFSATQSYNHIIDAAAYWPFKKFAPLLKPKGRYVLVGGSTALLFACMLKGPFFSMFSGKKYLTLMAQAKKQDLNYVAELLQAKKIAAHIDKVYPLAQLPQADRKSVV